MQNNLSNMAILITGGAGYIGSHMALNLLEIGITPIIIDNLSSNYGKLIPKQAIFYQGNVGDRPLVESIIQKHNITSIIHFAASIIVPESVTQPLKYYLNNTMQTTSLLKSAVCTGVKNFLFSSTAAVYGMAKTPTLPETTPLNPINPYGTSKMMSEMILQDVASAHGLIFGILRYFNVAGADSNLRAGQINENATHLIKVAAEAAIGKRKHVEIFGTDFNTEDGTGVRDYIHVSDLVQIHRQTLQLMHETQESQLFNCGYGTGFSVRQVLQTMNEIILTFHDLTSLKIIESPRRTGDPDCLIANHQLLCKKLDFNPQYNHLDKILKSALLWERHLLNAQ